MYRTRFHLRVSFLRLISFSYFREELITFSEINFTIVYILVRQKNTKRLYKNVKAYESEALLLCENDERINTISVFTISMETWTGTKNVYFSQWRV